MKQTWKRTLSGVLAAAFLCGGTGLIVHAAGQTEPAAPQTQQSQTTVPQTAAAPAAAGDGTVKKEETVYVLADAAGTPKQILVSDWIRNDAGAASVTDTGELEDVENVKGEAGYTINSAGMRVWDAQGEDIYCRGTSAKVLPVDVTVQYLLDGVSVTPEELAGKSGKVTMRFTYTNNQYETLDVNGQRETIYAPFVMLTGMVLDNDTFRNVTVSNGKLLNDGDRTLVLGFALPGMKENLGAAAASVELPDFVEITAEAENFSLTTTMTLATNELFSSLDPDTLSGNGGLSAVSGTLNTLLDGSSSLYAGLSGLLDQADALVDGVAQLADGAQAVAAGMDTLSGSIGKLNTGLQKLDQNSAALQAGAGQVFDVLLNEANSQLKAAGIQTDALTKTNYTKVLQGVLGSLDEKTVRQMAVNTATDTVTKAVRAQESTIRTGVENAVRQQVYQGVLAAMHLTEETLDTATRAQVNAVVDGKMQEAANQKIVEQQTEQTIQGLIAQKMASAEVQDQINTAVAAAKAGAGSIQALLAQLDQYHTFYQGLMDYTAGVGTAATGSKQIAAGAGTLAEGTQTLKNGVLELQSSLSGIDEASTQARELLERVRAMVRVSRDYSCYSGVADGMEGSVRFIYRTEAIEK